MTKTVLRKAIVRALAAGAGHVPTKEMSQRAAYTSPSGLDGTYVHDKPGVWIASERRDSLMREHVSQVLGETIFWDIIQGTFYWTTAKKPTKRQVLRGI